MVEGRLILMAKKNMPWYDVLAFILLIAGGLNWGLVAWFNFNLVEFLSFGMMGISKIVYSLVGISGVYGLFTFWKLSKK